MMETVTMTPKTVSELETYVREEVGLRIAVVDSERRSQVLQPFHGSTRLVSISGFERAIQPFRIPVLRADMTVAEAESALLAAWGLEIEILLNKSGPRSRAKDTHRLGADSIGFRPTSRVRKNAEGPPCVFISYRRDTGSELAQMVCQFLEDRGIQTFLDVENLGAGRFDEQIREQIEQCTHVVVICSRGSLANRGDGKDWLYEELALALRAGVTLIPFTTKQFEWPDRAELPRGMTDLFGFQAFPYSHESWRATREKFLQMIQPTAVESQKFPDAVP